MGQALKMKRMLESKEGSWLTFLKIGLLMEFVRKGLKIEAKCRQDIR